jgi:hypothetical protein
MKGHAMREEATLCGNFVLLHAEGLQLLLPQCDVASAEHLGAAERGRLRAGRGGNGDDEVVALTGALRPLAHLPADRFVLTRLGARGTAFAWNAVRVLLAAELPRHPLPAALCAPGMPVDSYVEIDGGLALCTSAQRLLDFVAGVEE